MKIFSTLIVAVVGAAIASSLAVAADNGPAPQPIVTGPTTEQRFPPLRLPEGFRATLFACDPLIEYPSAITTGIRPGTLFVAVDYMTGLGTEIIRRDEIRLVEDTDGDGYADRANVVADGFQSIEGLARRGDTLFVMHAPYLTSVRLTDDGQVERRDLLKGLGLPPEENPVRLHCANGITVGHDGWLYLALGDHGCNVVRPEGDRLILNGGGILRCRPDGRDLHIFSTGLRNIYDVALDEDLNVFVRDNENDGGNYKLRVCHSFFGADHGYPYLYEERPDEALAPLADVGLGSSAGGACYLEHQFPAEYRNNLFFCEWGRAVVRYPLKRSGATFAHNAEVEFAAGNDADTYPFKPSDLVVDRDGSLWVADWADGQRPLRGRGRIYRITYAGSKDDADNGLAVPAITASTDLPTLVAALNSPSYAARCEAQLALERLSETSAEQVLRAVAEAHLNFHGRLHATWLTARLGGDAAVEQIFSIIENDSGAKLRAQAIRALADLVDPVLAEHRLDAGPGDATIAARLAKAAADSDPRVVLEATIALGRLHWRDAADWVRRNGATGDAAQSHASMQTLRRAENDAALLALIDEPSDAPIRPIALRAPAEQSRPAIAAGLIERLRTERDSARRMEYADLLTRIYKRPGPWTYWGFRPAPRPAGTVAWESTAAIASALDEALLAVDDAMRIKLLERMNREQVPVRTTTATQLLATDRRPETAAAIVESMAGSPDPAPKALLTDVIRRRDLEDDLRGRATTLLAAKLNDADAGILVGLLMKLEDGPTAAAVLRAAAKFTKLPLTQPLLDKFGSSAPEVQIAAIETAVERRTEEAREPIVRLLGDADAAVRRAATIACGKLAIREAVEPLWKLLDDQDAAERRAAFDALRRLQEPRLAARAVAALDDREVATAALACIADLGTSADAPAIRTLAEKSPSIEIAGEVVKMLDRWSRRDGVSSDLRDSLEQDIAQVHGAGGNLLRWQVSPPVDKDAASAIVERFSSSPTSSTEHDSYGWNSAFGVGVDGRVQVERVAPADAPEVRLAYADVYLAEPAAVEFQIVAGEGFRLWLNGRAAYERQLAATARADDGRVGLQLAKGTNRVLVQAVAAAKPIEFQVRFRRKSAQVEHERLTQSALTRQGRVDRGKQLFFNAEKSLCLKCHRLDGKGEQIGPELTGVGARFARPYLIESILDPSRAIAPSFATIAVVLDDGRILSGVKTAETTTTITLADNQGKQTIIERSQIEEQQPQSISTMAVGLEKRFSQEEFVDLIAFLASRKERPDAGR